MAVEKRNLRQRKPQRKNLLPKKTCCQEEIGSEEEERRQKRRRLSRKESSCEKSCKEKRRNKEKLGFQSTYMVQSQSVPRHSCSPLPMYPQPDPHPGVDALLKTKGEVQLERPVDSLSKLFFGLLLSPFLAISNRSLWLAGFQRPSVACTLRRC
jgi:hypothetical protein